MTIENERQFLITLEDFKNFSMAAYYMALNKDQRTDDVHPMLKQVSFDAECSKIQDFMDEISDYMHKWATREMNK